MVKGRTGISFNQCICRGPTALLRETCYSDEAAASSAIPALHNSIEAIKTRDEVGINKYASIVRKIGLLASGAEKTFGFAEIETSNKHVVRVDNFLKERVSTASDHIKGKWFAGAVYGSFDGTLRFVDTRGQLPQIKLILSAGGKELDCTCSREDIETLGNILDQRVMIYGRAIYVGSSPIPARVEVSSFQPIKKDADFSKWQGSFHPFEEIWDGE